MYWISTLRNQLAAIYDRIIAADPGLDRLLLASRATATSLLALGVMFGLGKITPASLPATLLAVIIAMISSVVVNDDTPKQQKITTLILPLFAAASVLLGTVLAGFAILSKVVFVAVLFGAVYARRYGVRGLAAGMLTFITYFFSVFLHPKFSQLPWLMLALAIGTACNYIMHFFAFRISSEWRLKVLLGAYYARIGRIIDKVIKAIPESVDERNHSHIRRQIVELNENALMIEDELGDILYPEPSEETDQLSSVLALFDLELAIDRLGEACHEELPKSKHEKALENLKRLQRITRQRNRGQSFEGHVEFENDAAEEWDIAIQNLAATLSRSPNDKDIQTLLSEANGQEEKKEENTDNNGGKEEDKSEKRLHPSTRQAIQVAVAGGLAILAGYFISQQRWYWAVITAFIVFTGASSGGEIFRKGLQRTAGTLFGVIAGIFIALAVGNNTNIAITLIYICIFTGFYLIQISYALMIFWITIAIGLLYELFGLSNVENLLILRLEETALGAAIGIIVAFLLLPTRTSESIRDASHDFMNTLDELVDACASQFTNQGSARAFMILSRNLDRDFQQLRDDSKPLTYDFLGRIGRNSTRQWLHALMECRFYARRLSRFAHQDQLNDKMNDIEYPFSDTAEHIHRNIQALINQKGEADSTLNTNLDKIDPELHNLDVRIKAARCMQHIDSLIIKLGHNFG